MTDEKPLIARVVEGFKVLDGGDVFLAIAESTGKSYWILDSSYSSHMCLVTEHFDTYQSCEKDIINMANSRVIGVGTVRIRTLQGVVRRVTGVRHVLGVKRNLISLGAFDARGY